MTTTIPDIDSLIADFGRRHLEIGAEGARYCDHCEMMWPCPDRILIDALATVYEAAKDVLSAWPNIVNHPRFDNVEVAALRAALERNPR